MKQVVITAVIFLGAQGLLIAVFLFGDFGFDHAGPRGDFNDHMNVLFLYVIVLLIGVVWSILAKQWKLLALQLTIPFLVLVAIIVYENIVKLLRS